MFSSCAKNELVPVFSLSCLPACVSKSLAETLGTTNLFGTLGNSLPVVLDPEAPEAAGLGRIAVLRLFSAGVLCS